MFHTVHNPLDTTSDAEREITSMLHMLVVSPGKRSNRDYDPLDELPRGGLGVRQHSTFGSYRPTSDIHPRVGYDTSVDSLQALSPPSPFPRWTDIRRDTSPQYDLNAAAMHHTPVVHTPFYYDPFVISGDDHKHDEQIDGFVTVQSQNFPFAVGVFGKGVNPDKVARWLDPNRNKIHDGSPYERHGFGSHMRPDGSSSEHTFRGRPCTPKLYERTARNVLHEREPGGTGIHNASRGRHILAGRVLNIGGPTNSTDAFYSRDDVKEAQRRQIPHNLIMQEMEEFTHGWNMHNPPTPQNFYPH
jgi:hypothetical protein